ncbi:MAG TPA: hypothetical protein VG963_23305, partial [Polyangiaceae bacterium]|nr:hypothetical protein [Polyangiaceae bacterium]
MKDGFKIGAHALFALALFSVGACHHSEDQALLCTPDEAGQLYQDRIAPVLTDARPKSCNQCHLSGIDLSLFVKSTPCQTMACMQKLGLVDLEHPDQSKVLGWIGRAKPQSELITASVIDQEYDGFRDWIRYSATCGTKVCEAYADPCGEDVPDTSSKCDVSDQIGAGFVDPGDCSELTMEQLFSADVYQWRERCFPCHFSSDQNVQAPKWVNDVNNVTQASTLACATASLETMRNVLSWGLVDLDAPSNSLLLLKPLSVEAGGVMHGGGHKFTGASDETYQQFLAWITRYAACTAQNPALARAG